MRKPSPRRSSIVYAMARSHDLLSREQWSEISLRDVVTQEIEPYRLGRGDRVVIEGPPVPLTPKRALSLGMVIHELGTNSMKHGALSATEGSVEITWALEPRKENSLV